MFVWLTVVAVAAGLGLVTAEAVTPGPLGGSTENRVIGIATPEAQVPEVRPVTYPAARTPRGQR